MSTAALSQTPTTGPKGTNWSIRDGRPTAPVLGYVEARTHALACEMGRGAAVYAVAYPEPMPRPRPAHDLLRKPH